ncbi:MAG TPA: type II toxin-antitoxin system VapC family toxin [Azospirillaceae bacterium]|nr:type II toxin-antitoxin system VapC family toxin [Azospirillaceae bacterium]
MIILDTNVLSAVMQATPDPVVADWLDRRPAESLWLTSITVFEVIFGLELLAPGRRRRELESAFARCLEEDFQGRILHFDAVAAKAAALIAARRRKTGLAVEIRDTQIAGIVTARRATLATRNLRHFSDIDADVIDPWAG